MILSLDELKKIRTLTVIALFSDDDLMDTLVLKGGNALELAYGFNSRSSVDIDLSMRQDFSEIGLIDNEQIQLKLQTVLTRTFTEFNYQVFDVHLKVKPKKAIPTTEDFWGGYEVNFKIIEINKYDEYKGNPIKLAAKSIPVNSEKKNIKIDFGRFEYCGDTTTVDLEGFTVPIYSPTLIILEKIRAICQQMGEYLEYIGKDEQFGRPRPRDFYDIYTILEHPDVTEINFEDLETLRHLKECFKAKKVPLDLISKIKDTYEFHNQDEYKLRDSVMNKRQFKGFDFYFSYVINLLTEKKLIELTDVA
ncbi:MAG: nucleotidyl transferase AbiEii/AbiGii toxin family protein [Paenibacillaceae bacterium]